jgi:uncharacterized membrane-anchored protein
MKSAPRLWILSLSLAAFAPGLPAAAEDVAEAATATVEAAPSGGTANAAAEPESLSAESDLMAGPLDLSLGAEAYLSLPEGWHWVPKDRLQAYFGNDGREAGAWDLGLALSPGQPLFEFRVQFEPLGAVAEPTGALDPAALLAKVQAGAAAANTARRISGGVEVQIPAWADEPAYDAGSKRLTWGEHRVSGADERRGWHARLLGRAGVLKIDAEGPEDLMQLQVPLLQTLFNGLSLAEGRGLADHGSTDKAAPVDLTGLLLEGTLGRGSLNPAGPPAEPLPPVAIGTLEAAAALLLAWGSVAAWRGLQRRRHMQATVAAEVERLGKLEKELGQSADDVEEVKEDGNDAAATKGDDT